MSLPTPERFAEFYRTIYGYDAFPWQQRLAARVCAGEWPHAIALPTAAGKTACIDIAVYSLACNPKKAPRRIFFVVDRRIVVDQAKMHADNLAKQLRDATSGLLKEVADSLRIVSDDERPLDVYSLRGGMYRETAWTRSPLQPTVIASTVDQVGSRLLFRGYGVSDSMKPIHAALVGNDSLIFLDEAHCSKPFDQTMQAVKQYRGWNDSTSPFHFVSITATPTGEGATEKDEEDDRNHPVLGKRISASKPAKLVIADKAKGKNATAELVKVLGNQARELSKEFACVGIIVNRVKTARELKKLLGDDAVLLTGRMRSLDRERLFDERLRPLLSNAEGSPPKFVIGTQCLECGADFDFHALVTECASLDALRQRFGRLNRVARRENAKAVIVIQGDQVEDTSEDPVYGESLANTWKWLMSKASNDVFDFGILAVRTAIGEEDITSLNAPAADAPILFPAHLDCWVQTNPIPTPDPDPALFLHGPKRPTQPDVQIVFRNDLGNDPDAWMGIVSLCPPSSSESVPVPISVFKKWLAADDSSDQSSDVEGEASVVEDEVTVTRSALRWQGPEKSGVVGPGDRIIPNAVYVVPCSAEGTELLGDFPYGLNDYGEQAFQRSRDKAILRLLGSNLSDDDAEDFEDLLTEEIQALLKDDSPEWLKLAVHTLANPKNRVSEVHPLSGWVVTGKCRLRQYDPTYLEDTEPAESFRGQAVTLVDHSQGVADYAKRFAKGCGLDESLYYQVGLWHDLGKLDPRFQAMLKQCSPRTAVGTPWAKSARSPRTKQERDEARQVHRYPSGARHELLSAALIATKSNDELLLHLISTHHGSGRPFADPVEENEAAKTPFNTPELFGASFALPTCAQEIAVWNASLPERFWHIVRKLGWWGAAYHETLFRLADHAQSHAEQEQTNDDKSNEGVILPPFQLQSKSGSFLPLPMTGIDGSNPLAFLAALGTLRLSHELFPGTTLHWKRSGTWQPVLQIPTEVTFDQFLDQLHERVHRTTDLNASNAADAQHASYRAMKKTTDAALKSIKDRKLRGKDRAAAISAEVTPLRDQELAARRSWLQALETAVPAPFLSLGKSISVSAEEYGDFAVRMLERLHADNAGNRIDADFAAAFGCEACVDRNGRVIPTEFQLITGSGHQFFLDTFGTLMECVTIDQLRRALLGPWTYSDPRLSFRWDPLDDRRYAVSWDDPSSNEVRTEHGANVLAAYALPFFPVIPLHFAAGTTGFTVDNEGVRFVWPIWADAHGLESVRSLLQIDYQDKKNRVPMIRRQIGVQEVFQVRKIEVGKAPLSKLNFTPSTTA